jgi:Family of unknown function (DUF6328)
VLRCLSTIEKYTESPNATGPTARFEKVVYFATLICAGASAIMIVAPVSYHRVVFRRHDKHALLIRSNTLVMIGLALFALTIFGVITIVSDFVFSVTLTVIADSVFLIAVAMLWYVLPLRSRRHAVERLRVARDLSHLESAQSVAPADPRA